MHMQQPGQRLLSLDAFRGFIMLMMASAGFGLVEVGKANPGSFWEGVVWSFSHVDWRGCAPWDLIQPAFMFMVGVAVPYSYLKRAAGGQGFVGMAWHALSRSLLLVLLGVLLATRSGDAQTNWLFTNVLAQIGLGYFALFLLWRMGPEYEVSGIVVILVAYWIWFWRHPPPEEGFDWARWGMDSREVMTGLMAHWNKHVNAAAEFDRWFLNLLPRSERFEINSGGYQTLNFVPSLATMLAGSLTGRYLMGRSASDSRKAATLAVAGVFLLFAGTLLGLFVCPLVKRIWTPSWAVFSTGWVLLMLAGFHWLTEVRRWRGIVFPLVVVGMNSIFIYLMNSWCGGWIRQMLKVHLPDAWFDMPWGPVVERCGGLAVLWLLCYWLYRQRAFIKL
jgi:heparan-alpha-glucosaminide N-acetyltransferase